MATFCATSCGPPENGAFRAIIAIPALYIEICGLCDDQNTTEPIIIATRLFARLGTVTQVQTTSSAFIPLNLLQAFDYLWRHMAERKHMALVRLMKDLKVRMEWSWLVRPRNNPIPVTRVICDHNFTRRLMRMSLMVAAQDLWTVMLICSAGAVWLSAPKIVPGKVASSSYLSRFLKTIPILLPLSSRFLSFPCLLSQYWQFLWTHASVWSFFSVDLYPGCSIPISMQMALSASIFCNRNGLRRILSRLSWSVFNLCSQIRMWTHLQTEMLPLCIARIPQRTVVWFAGVWMHPWMIIELNFVATIAYEHSSIRYESST